MNRLNILPEDVARLVWRKVFDDCIKEISNDGVKTFYNTHLCDIQDDIKTKEKQIEGLNKRYKICKNKENNRQKWDKYIYELADLQVRDDILIMLSLLSYQAQCPQNYGDKLMNWFNNAKSKDRNDKYEDLKEIYRLRI